MQYEFDSRWRYHDNTSQKNTPHFLAEYFMSVEWFSLPFGAIGKVYIGEF